MVASPWSKIHVFPYSERQGTRAALFTETVELRERKARALRIRELSDERLSLTIQKQLGSVKKVLILKQGGLSRDYFNIDLQSVTELRAGQEVTAEVIAIQNREGREPLLIAKSLGVLS